ncbi:putative Quercetin 2,3-dioxygenase [Nitrosotalea sinensis]|jgi:redox-sensitive bicupin YhaK (pirin superfamily)|uniref:Putative Quercetin 2,3-dioxygenase n=1 Tax=Nitrosotalea sinensis TaxID=1499975 RepID=A0A2H1EGM2_9ARCH|nr:pirin family protein [Candidatus Nitrosotalea sinensis]SHO45554.1 putative Quercetin 2,3-dioxygenase [Candidatus Nitrosotalea sinensis]
MIKITKENQHYKGESEWLETYHHFSFAEYFDPSKVNFGPLRVFNDDVIKPGTGFDFHQHQDMEIVTYVIDGTLEHKDSLGNHGLIQPGEIQRMSAGTGVFHSEFNHSDTKPLRLLQMWVFSDTKGLKPSWEQKQYSKDDRTNNLLQVIGQKDASKQDSLGIHQDASFYVSNLRTGSEIQHNIIKGRIAYLFVIEGKVSVNGKTLDTRDAAKIQDESKISIQGQKESEIILIDLPVQFKKNSMPAEAA